MTISAFPRQTRRILALSARSPEALRAARERLAEHLTAHPTLSVHDVSVTLDRGREHMPWRWAAVAGDLSTAVAALRSTADGERRPSALTVEGYAEPHTAPQVVLAFSGGGLHWTRQHVVAACQAFGEVRSHFEHAVAVLDGELPESLGSWLADSAEDELPDPAVVAPVTHALDVAMARQLRSWVLSTDVCVGDGVTELAASAVSGTVAVDDALRRVVGWGRLVADGSVEPAPAGLGYLDWRQVTGGKPAVVVEMAPEPSLPPSPGGLRGSGPRMVRLRLAEDGSPNLLTLLAELWTLGVAVDLSTGLPGRRVRLPAYAFQRASSFDTDREQTAGLRPLTAFEQRLLFHDLVRSANKAENTVAATGELPDSVNVDRLQASFAELQLAHPALRTRFCRIGAQWRARVRPDSAPLSTGIENTSELSTIAFAPGDEVMIRGALIARTGGGHVIGLAAHRALTEHSTLDMLVDELIDRYVTSSATLPANGL